MGKLQPNFSWQKYEGSEENQKSQFQYQLQRQHTVVANALNSTINDLSYFLQERQTGFAWVNNKPIFTQTQPTVTWTVGNTTNVIPFIIPLLPGQTFTVIDMVCVLSNGTVTRPVPYVGVLGSTNASPDLVQMSMTGLNVTLLSNGTNYSAFSGYVTLYYVKS